MTFPKEFLACRDCACDRIRKASRAITQHYEDQFRGSGLRATQFTVLSTLLQTGPLSISRLAAFLGLERTTLTRNLNPLLRQKLVHVSAATDGRMRVVAITPKGQSTAKKNLPRWQQAQASAGELLSSFKISLR